MSTSMKDRVALVTGSSHGIGAATAKLLARKGAAIGVNYHSSHASKYITGSYLAVDGGLLM